MLSEGKKEGSAAGHPRATIRAPYGHGRHGSKLAIPLIQHRGQPFKPAPGIPIFQKDPFGKIFCRRPMAAQHVRDRGPQEHPGEMGKFMYHWHYDSERPEHGHMGIAGSFEGPIMIPMRFEVPLGTPSFEQHRPPAYHPPHHQPYPRHHREEPLPSARMLFQEQLRMEAPRRRREEPGTSEQEVASFLADLNSALSRH